MTVHVPFFICRWCIPTAKRRSLLTFWFFSWYDMSVKMKIMGDVKMALITKTLSSLHKVYPEEVPQVTYTGGTVLRNEPFSFQIAYKTDDGNIPLYLHIEAGELPICHYRVDYVPLLKPRNGGDGLGERTQPGLYPDVLRRRLHNPPVADESVWTSRWYEKGEKHLITAVEDSWQSLWFTVNEDGEPLPAGTYPVTVRFYDQRNQVCVGQQTITVTLLEALLPEQSLLYTNWFHADCLCDLHRVKMFSDDFFTILEDYIRVATRHGMNMILLPAFTPALDTPVGTERMTAQLVGVTVTDEGGYTFDFSLMKRFLDVCRRAGATHFEHSHFFTQWGAKAAPKVVATVQGEERRIFGWDTPATGEYATFLRAYVTALRPFLQQEGLDDKVLYHISDEPQGTMAEDYRAAREVVVDLLDGCMLGDALSHYELYEQGLAEIPIVCTHSIEPFIGKCDNLWCYYTGGQIKGGLSNRLISLCSPRNRILGLQMYRYDIKGFLHWGYNYYYGCMSHGVSDVTATPGMYEMTNGSPYVVYPGFDGTCLPSIRLKVFGEGVCDMRALQTLESLTDRQTVCDLLDGLFEGGLTFHTCVVEPEEYERIRRVINEAIAANIQKG
ncbi:MAG: DUF4091 domain-containing protein [Ruminococcaceae bacterium]|nr:DUF4091 domain-containing protein [Oscillospiraceae bacterium]